MFKRLRLALILITVMASVLGGCAPKPVEKDTLRIGSLPRTFDLIAYVAQQEGLFDRQGIQVEIVPFRSTIEMNSALLTGELDGIVQDTFEAVNLNKGETIAKLVGSAVMPRMFEVVASAESGINNVADLKGREVAVANSTIMEYALDRLLLTNGLDSGDIVKVNIASMPLRLEALNQGRVAAAILTPPLSDLAVVNGGKVIINDIEEPFAGPGLIFSLEALENKSDTISRCVQAWQEATKLINANPEKYQSLLNQVAFVPESVNLEVPTYPKLNLPVEESVESVVDWMIAEGLMNVQLTYEELVDTSYLSR
jgi:NitT/TauT family transport system substrate-binding protein